MLFLLVASLCKSVLKKRFRLRMYEILFVFANLLSFFYKMFATFRKMHYLCTRKSPDGGIGRRAGLKHQWGNPCRFDPGSGYNLYRNALVSKQGEVL